MGFALTRDLIATSDTPVVVGLGDTGLSCARYFAERGVPCVVVDSRERPPGLTALRRDYPGLEILLGDIPGERLLNAGRLVVSPGLGLDHPALAEALARGVPVCGDVDLFVAEASAPVVGITGSNGKSTVTELLGRMAARAGVAVAVGGNLGPPALELLDAAVELYVLELSSFQLERAGRLGLELACVLNMSVDHLDRHGSLPDYHRVKHRIFAGCGSLVYNREDLLTRPLQADTAPCRSFGLTAPDLGDLGLRTHAGEEYLCEGVEPLMPVAELGLLGRHNIANALACLALGRQLELSLPAMLEELREFTGLAHRCRNVGEVDGVRFVDDSKATNPGAAQAALKGLAGEGDLVLIAGGRGKGADFGPLCEDIVRACRGVVLIGEDAALLERLLRDRLPLVRATSMRSAVAAAATMAAAGGCVLLSPACASFDMFADFAERGEAFVAAVASLGAAGGEHA